MTGVDYEQPPARTWHSGFGGFLLRDWPYVLMLLLSLGGVAYTSFNPTGLYWVLITPLFGLICVIARWPHVVGRDEHIHLVISQALHWAAVLVTMQLMSLQVLRNVTGVASALSVLTLLALGTFSAGLHIRSWKVSVVGFLLGLSVPAAALLQQSALLIVLVVAVLIAIAVPFVWMRARSPVGPEHPLYEAPTRTESAPMTATPTAPVAQTTLFEPPLFDPPGTTPAPRPSLHDPVLPPKPAAPPTVDTAEPGPVIDPVLPETTVPEPPRDPAASTADDGEPKSDNVRPLFGGR
ncbi:hypothetical protein IP86_18130 [Rhodopseudomonas sp. AAP120]|uniref:hypothetical protein n=1 Tax=Rhodopseudomonas sp. AAP120 TaxID=1523430 RepID=UPI0006B92B3D|nr:hypothetical protein [Rhodopseudomonas sp. AAP120]KPF95760.1 hypothetical protein IP86_18130 [Rhodopseudomonas sp. AAP120]